MKVLWTDGSAKPNPGPGGFAVIENGEPVFLGAEEQTTNNRMEGLAIATAIRYADGQECEIHSDSEYWVKTLTEWAPTWAAQGWRRGKRKEEIKNIEMVQKLYEMFTNSKVKLNWTRGHVGTEMNEKADEWAEKARTGEVPEEFTKQKTARGATIWSKVKGKV